MAKIIFLLVENILKSMISKDQFIEYQSVYGNLYGSTKENVLNQLDEGHDVILEIDYKGMMKIKSIYPEAITIYSSAFYRFSQRSPYLQSSRRS